MVFARSDWYAVVITSHSSPLMHLQRNNLGGERVRLGSEQKLRKATVSAVDAMGLDLEADFLSTGAVCN